MRPPVLAVRVSRRAVAAVVLSNEQLLFFDGRHLRSGRDASREAIRRYAQVLIGQARPSTAVIDCPMQEQSATPGLVAALKQAFADARIATVDVPAAEILRAFRMGGLPTRLRVRAMAAPLFAELAAVRLGVKPFLIDAAACALYAESAAALGILRT
jgi:hypothetical protein